jgi:hypothetical protein
MHQKWANLRKKGRAMRKHTKTESSSDDMPHPVKEPVPWQCKLNLPGRLSEDI